MYDKIPSQSNSVNGCNNSGRVKLFFDTTFSTFGLQSVAIIGENELCMNS